MGPKALAATAEHSSRDDPAPGVAHPADVRRAVDPAMGSSHAMATGPTTPDFELVYAEHFNFVWRSLRLLGVAPEALEDASQDVFSVVCRQLGRFEGRSSLRTWLFAILQRVAANHRRMRRRKLVQLEPLDDSFVDRGPTPHAHAEAAEVLGVIEGFCDRLDEQWRAVFVLALLESIPAHEVSQALGIPLNTVYSRVHSLRVGLRRALAQREEERGRG
jgi:RNA polymerase sigma-70 factor (ECF subfamily)